MIRNPAKGLSKSICGEISAECPQNGLCNSFRVRWNLSCLWTGRRLIEGWSASTEHGTDRYHIYCMNIRSYHWMKGCVERSCVNCSIGTETWRILGSSICWSSRARWNWMRQSSSGNRSVTSWISSVIHIILDLKTSSLNFWPEKIQSDYRFNTSCRVYYRSWFSHS